MSNAFKRTATTPDRIKEALKLSGKKQIDLSRETGIDKGSISNYIAGRYEPKNEAIYKMALSLGVSEMWLWGYDVPMERSQEQKNNDAFNDIVRRLQTDSDFFSAVEALNAIDSAPADIVPDSIRKLVDFAKNVPEDKAEMILQVMKTIVEAD